MREDSQVEQDLNSDKEAKSKLYRTYSEEKLI